MMNIGKIKASELRLGDWVPLFGDGTFKVEKITASGDTVILDLKHPNGTVYTDWGIGKNVLMEVIRRL